MVQLAPADFLLIACFALTLDVCGCLKDGETYKVEEGLIREGHTFNDPSKLITTTPIECCELCMEDPKCVSWTRHRPSGACAFKDTLLEVRRNPMFDTGVVGGVPAAQYVPVDDWCVVEWGVDFWGGDLDVESASESENAGGMLSEVRGQCVVLLLDAQSSGWEVLPQRQRSHTSAKSER